MVVWSVPGRARPSSRPDASRSSSRCSSRGKSASASSRADSVPAVRHGRCYHSLDTSAALKKAALAAADRSILLLDHTKTPRTGPHLICDVERFAAVVVDDEADPAEVRAMRATGTQVVLVPASRHEGAAQRT